MLLYYWIYLHYCKKVIKCLASLLFYEPWHGISNNVVYTTSKTSDQPAHICSLIRAFDCRLNILWVLSYWLDIIWSSKLKRGLSIYHIVVNHMSQLIYLFLNLLDKFNNAWALMQDRLCYLSIFHYLNHKK